MSYQGPLSGSGRTGQHDWPVMPAQCCDQTSGRGGRCWTQPCRAIGITVEGPGAHHAPAEVTGKILWYRSGLIKSLVLCAEAAKSGKTKYSEKRQHRPAYPGGETPEASL